jgi:signal transduction histidine kinase
MRRLRLGPLLTGLNVGLLVIALAALAFVAIQALQQRTDALALAQVTQATNTARSLVLQTGEGLAEKAELLALEPALENAIEANDPAAASTALNKFEQVMHLTNSGVMFNGHLFAQSGPPLNWADLWAKHNQTSSFFFQPASADASLTLVAWAGIPSSPNGIVLVAVPLNDSVLQPLSQSNGLPFSLVTPSTTPAGDALSTLRLQAQTLGQPQAARLPNPERYVSVAPITSAIGEVSVLVETELLADQNILTVNQLIQNLLLVTLAAAVVLAFISYLLGRRLGNPIQALAVSADRIGRGELEQPVPPAPGVEVGELSAALEEMRWRLRQLTSTLRREQAESNAIVNGIAEGVFIVDRERRIQFLNPQAAEMLGIEAKGAVGRFCGDVLNPQGVGGLRPCEEDCPIIHARFRAGARATEHLLLANGLRRSVIITSAPALQELAAGSGSGLRQIQVMRDETEEEATRRIRDAVLANISHEFKTPLSAQLASIEMLLDQLPELEPAQIAELVISLQRGTLRLTQLIDNLLESVRIEAGRLTIRNKAIEIEDILEEALEMIRPLLNQRNQEVQFDLPYPLPALNGDAPRLVQVFVNLLANANKFAPNGSTIHIGGTVTPDSLIVSVEDQGPGLPEGEAELFVPFMRSTIEEPEAQGIGLGLWIVKSIIERHGGQVTATSSVAGTKIAVRLPRTGSDESTHS